MTVKLQRLAMTWPNDEGIYSPQPTARIISDAEFMQICADAARLELVSVAPDGVSDPQPMTVYAVQGWPWMIVGGKPMT